jgi:hypothetical protein
MLEADDTDVVRDFKFYTAKEADDCITFLEGLYTPGRVITVDDTDKIARSIVAVVLLVFRLEAILKEFEGVNLEDDNSFCDNGFTSLAENRTLERSRNLVTRLCDLWGNDHVLKDVLVSKELYLIVLVPALNCASPEEVTNLGAGEFRKRIDHICTSG